MYYSLSLILILFICFFFFLSLSLSISLYLPPSLPLYPSLYFRFHSLSLSLMASHCQCYRTLFLGLSPSLCRCCSWLIRQPLDGPQMLHRKGEEMTMNQSKTTILRSGNLKGGVFLTPDITFLRFGEYICVFMYTCKHVCTVDICRPHILSITLYTGRMGGGVNAGRCNVSMT